MSVIITNNSPANIYQLCDPTEIKESQFEQDVLRVINNLYPQWMIFPFRPEVRYFGSVWKPDLAIVDRQHNFWFVVEVEIATHHLEKHVLPQVTALKSGDYVKSAASMIATQLKISEEEASTLMAYVPRETVVISNRRDKTWDEKLAALGIQHLVISEYRESITRQSIHKVDGAIVPAQKSLGFGRVKAIDHVIVTKAGNFWREGNYEIDGPEGVASWYCLIDHDKAWLMKKKGIIEFLDETVVQFILSSTNQIILRQPYVSKT